MSIENKAYGAWTTMDGWWSEKLNSGKPHDWANNKRFSYEYRQKI